MSEEQETKQENTDVEVTHSDPNIIRAKATSKDHAVKLLLREAPRPSSRIILEVDLPDDVDEEEVRLQLDDERKKQRESQNTEAKHESKEDYHETDLFKKLQALKEGKLQVEEPTEAKDEKVEEEPVQSTSPQQEKKSSQLPVPQKKKGFLSKLISPRK